jgi:hypothetical protein
MGTPGYECFEITTRLWLSPRVSSTGSRVRPMMIKACEISQELAMTGLPPISDVALCNRLVERVETVRFRESEVVTADLHSSTTRSSAGASCSHSEYRILIRRKADSSKPKSQSQLRNATKKAIRQSCVSIEHHVFMVVNLAVTFSTHVTDIELAFHRE